LKQGFLLKTKLGMHRALFFYQSAKSADPGTGIDGQYRSNNHSWWQRNRVSVHHAQMHGVRLRSGAPTEQEKRALVGMQ